MRSKTELLVSCHLSYPNCPLPILPISINTPLSGLTRNVERCRFLPLEPPTPRPPTSFNFKVTTSIQTIISPHLDQTRSSLQASPPAPLQCGWYSSFFQGLQANTVWRPSPHSKLASLLPLQQTSLLPQHHPCPQAFALAVPSAQNLLPCLISLPPPCHPGLKSSATSSELFSDHSIQCSSQTPSPTNSIFFHHPAATSLEQEWLHLSTGPSRHGPQSSISSTSCRTWMQDWHPGRSVITCQRTLGPHGLGAIPWRKHSYLEGLDLGRWGMPVKSHRTIHWGTPAPTTLLPDGGMRYRQGSNLPGVT